MSELVIGDANAHLFVPDNTGHVTINGDRRSCGLVPRDFVRVAYGSAGFAALGIPLIPRAEWPDRIADMERTKSSLRHVWEGMGAWILDQDGFSFCHGFSPAAGVRLLRGLGGQPDVELSGTGIAAPVVGYRDAGAWIMDDMRQVRDVGAPSVDFVLQLPNGRDSRSIKAAFKPGWEEDAAKHRAYEVVELRQRSLDELVTCLLSRVPVCNGRNYWSHATLDITVRDTGRGRVEDDNRWEIGDLNSWGRSFGEGGFFWLSGSKKYADEAYALLSVTAAAA